jgi:AcrR family transcriptional regulator
MRTPGRRIVSQMKNDEARPAGPPGPGARTWLESVRRLITAHVEDDSLVERRYHELIAAALRLFERRGFDRTTMEEIAAELGLSVGAIYRYVERKEDILLLTLAHTLWQFQVEVAAATEGVQEPAERLARAIDVYYRTIARDTRSTLLAYRESYVLEGERRQLVKDMELETNRIFEAILADGVARGTFAPCDVPLTAYTIVMLGHMWALKRWYLGRALSLDEYIERQRALVLAALRPAPGRRRITAAGFPPRAARAAAQRASLGAPPSGRQRRTSR